MIFVILALLAFSFDDFLDDPLAASEKESRHFIIFISLLCLAS